MNAEPPDKDQVRELFDRMLEAPAAERAAFIARECGTDTRLRGELDSLLRLHEAAGEALREPAPLDGAGRHNTAQAARAAFASAARPARDDSVLSAVERILGSAPHIALQSAEGSGGEPLIDPSTPERSTVPKQRGNYQILGEIARGGMGVVLRGHDGDLGRDVALKVLHRELARDPAVLQRFVEEAQIGGQLQHPGVVPVYELGLMSDERPFFTMKLIKGRTLASLLQERRLPSDERRRLLAIFEAVCQTIAYAHSRGVIHRDLKPANVMVGAFGEVQVVDWGLAKVLRRGGVDDERRSKRRDVSIIKTVRGQPGSSGSNSLSGSVMGTPAYMPPEQARGEVDRVDERTDVFALGAVLTEILTGDPPYVGTPRDVLELAREGRVESALERLEGCEADPELVELAQRCLARSPLDRPANAQVLSDALHEHAVSQEERVRDAQIEAAQAVVRARGERKARRLVVALAGVLALAAAGYAAYRTQQAARERTVQVKVQEALEEASLKRGRGDLAGALSAAERAVALVEAEGLEGELSTRSGDHLGEARAAVAEAERAAAERARMDAFVALLERARSLQRTETLASIEPQAARHVGLQDGRPGTASSTEHPHLQEELRVLAPREEEVDPTTAVGARLRAYGQAFARLGLDVDFDEPEALTAKIRATGRPEEVALALDGWALTLTKQGLGDSPAVRRRYLAADAVDSNATRRHLRAMLQKDDLHGLRELARDESIFAEQPVTLLALAHALDALDAEAEALALLDRAADVHPSDHQVLTQFGLALRAAGPERFPEARTQFTAARALKPDSVLVHQQLGWILCRQGLKEKGLRLLVEAVALDPGNEQAHAVLGAELAARNLHAEALVEYERAVAFGGERSSYLRAIVAGKVALADLDGASEVCRRAGELDPEASWWRLVLAACLHEQQQPDAALDVLREGAEVNVAVARQLANRLNETNRHQELADSSTAWLALWPDDPTLLVLTAIAQGRLGQVDESKATFDRALEVSPDRAVVWHRRCHMLADAGRTQEAIECLQTELANLESAPGNLSMVTCSTQRLAELTVKSTGDLEAVRKLKDRALASIQARLRDDPSLERYWEMAAALLQELGRDAEAVQTAREGLGRFPANGGMRLVLVKGLMRLGEREAALRESRSYREGFTVEAGLCSAFGYVLAIALEPELRDPREALAYVDLGLREEPDSPYLLSVRGIALCQLGELDAGIADIERGLPNYAKRGDNPEQNGTISWDWIYLASACEARGRREDALRAYGKALDLAQRTDHPEEGLLIPMLEELAAKLGLEPPAVDGR